jgi:hypothetical protein
MVRRFKALSSVSCNRLPIESAEVMSVAEVRAYREALPVTEIEITPEMIEAGVDALLGFEPDYQDTDAIIRSVLEAALQSQSASVWRR